jgi:hypothetical protein
MRITDAGAALEQLAGARVFVILRRVILKASLFLPVALKD